jgi:hypothetical protein
VIVMANQKDERSLGELLSELSRETGQLVRKEFELATTEMTGRAKRASAGAGVAAVGGALIHAGVLVMLAGLVIGLVQAGVSPWLSALIVAVATIIVGYALLTRGVGQVRRTRVFPTETIQSLKETATWTTRQGA